VIEKVKRSTFPDRADAVPEACGMCRRRCHRSESERMMEAIIVNLSGLM
jgi:hypothetical protein